jgi:SNF2 family DNA or RNA helicase
MARARGTWRSYCRAIDKNSGALAHMLASFQVARGPPFHVLLTSYDFLMSKTDRPRLARAHEWWVNRLPLLAAAGPRAQQLHAPRMHLIVSGGALPQECCGCCSAPPTVALTAGGPSQYSVLAYVVPPAAHRFRRRCIIVDEGHRLKNADCKLSRELRAYRSRARLLLTGGQVGRARTVQA